jgi:hypothetical protein
MTPEFFFKHSVIILVATITTGVIVYIVFHICCISIHKLLYFSFFSASFYKTFLSSRIASSISMHVLSILILVILYIYMYIFFFDKGPAAEATDVPQP